MAAGTLAVANLTGSEAQEEQPKYAIGELAGLEWSRVPNAELTPEQGTAVRMLYEKACKRDYPARLVEVIQTWEAALFYRGFQFLLPQRGGGWVIPGESTGYGPSMQMDLALLPTNVYSASGQMLIAALTRTVPTVQFGPMNATNDAQITTADSAEKYAKVFAKNNDLIMVQTDASRYLFTDGRFGYWTRFVKDGQKFGWEEDDEDADLVPENEPADEGQTPVEAGADASTPESAETAQESGEPAATEEGMENQELATPPEDEEGESQEEETTQRTPRGQEVRTAHGKLELKIVPMMANEQCDMDALILDNEVDAARAKGMFPHIADKIKAGGTGMNEGEIAKLARQNVKLGMQSTYITASSIANDVTISRAWFRPSAMMDIPTETVRDELIKMFPNGYCVCYAGEERAYIRNESMDDSWAIGQAYSGDGQNRNALGTSTLPVQKRLNNWLDLMNDFFVRAIPKKWLDSKTFDIETIRSQTNIPGDIGGFKARAGFTKDQLMMIEDAVEPSQTLADFIKEYAGPLRELLSGAYPALAGGDVGTADSGVAIATQRDSALGRLAPTWHSLKNCEALSTKQAVRWAAKCRDKSINERVPGGEVITLEINDLKGNIHCYAESDENIPATFTQKQNAFMKVFDSAVKVPQLGETFFNAANLKFLKTMADLTEIYIPEVLAYEKQLGEIEILVKSDPLPNPAIQEAELKIAQMHEIGVPGENTQQAQEEVQQLPPLVSSIQIDPDVDDSATEAMTCWQYMCGPEGRKLKNTQPSKYENLKLHFLDHKKDAAAKAAAAGGQVKPPSMSIGWKDVAQVDMGAAGQMLAKDGISLSPGATAPPPVPSANGSKSPATPLAVGATEGAGGSPKK